MSRAIFRLPAEAYINTMMPLQQHRRQEQQQHYGIAASPRPSYWAFATRVAAFIFEQVCLVVWGYFSFGTHATSVGRYFGLVLTLTVDLALVVLLVLADTRSKWKPSSGAVITLDALCVPFLAWGALEIFLGTKPYDYDRKPCGRRDWSERCLAEAQEMAAFAPEFYLSIVLAVIHSAFTVAQCIVCCRRREPRRLPANPA